MPYVLGRYRLVQDCGSLFLRTNLQHRLRTVFLDPRRRIHLLREKFKNMTVMDDKKTEREKDDSFIQSLDSLREILADESGTVDTSLLSDILTKASQETGIAFNEEALLEHLQPIIMTPESKGSTQLGLSLPRTTPLTSNTRIGSAQRMASQSHNRRSSNIFSFDTPSGKPSPLVNTTDSPNKPNAEGPGFFDTAEPSFSEDNSGFHVQIITKSDTNGM